MKKDWRKFCIFITFFFFFPLFQGFKNICILYHITEISKIEFCFKSKSVIKNQSENISGLFNFSFKGTKSDSNLNKI
jgi:hypothetical protein